MEKQSSIFKNTYRVYYEDTDAQGVVYYANYLRFYERARTDCLRELGINQSELVKSDNILFVVRRCEINYKASAKLDDLITVETQTVKIGNASIEMNQKLIREDGVVLNEAKFFLVCVNNKIRPTKVPENLRELLLK